MVSKYYGDNWIAKAFFDRFGYDNRRALQFAQLERVKIHTNRGFWRENAQGYADFEDAAWYEVAEALAMTEHLGPEKRVMYFWIK